MNKRLKTIIDGYLNEYTDWSFILNGYLKDAFSRGEISQDDTVKQIYSVVDILAKLAKSSIEFGNFKDVFEYDQFQDTFDGPELIINSEKTKTQYRIGFNSEGIYIQTYLKHNFSLKNMDDKFWIALVSLFNYGKFELIETEHFDKETRKQFPELFNNQSGIIFRLFRKYFVSILAANENTSSSEFIGSSGNLKVSWDTTFGLDKIVEECCMVFKILYKLNYSLWKIEDIKTKTDKAAR